MQAPDHIADLIFKFLREEISEEEEKQLTFWRRESAENERIFIKLTDPNQVQGLMQDFESRKRSWDKLLERAPELKSKEEFKVTRKRYYPIAAAILAILGVTALLIILTGKNKTPNRTEIAAKLNADSTKIDLLPGNKGTVLTLSNGHQIVLDSGNNMTKTDRLGDHIVQLDSGQIKYDNSTVGLLKDNSYDVLETPRGGQFQLVLPDGTKAWLNAASYIKYPVSFNGTERQVEMKGEIYFEVAKDAKKPFIIRTGNTQVKVLGTHFNVNAYSDEPFISVTLLEGSVQTSNGIASKMLVPGEQADILNNGISLKKDVDINRVVSWKNGRILFSDADLPSIMRMISRWYDVDVIYKGDIPKRSITGGISRSTNLSEILKVLEWNKIHFTVENRTITITP